MCIVTTPEMHRTFACLQSRPTAASNDYISQLLGTGSLYLWIQETAQLSLILRQPSFQRQLSPVVYTTSNIIYCITCTLCSKLYIEESGRKLGDRFREHLLDVKNKGSELSKPVARHFNLPGHSHEHMEICEINLHLGNNETRKRKEQRPIFALGTLPSNGINERFSFA